MRSIALGAIAALVTLSCARADLPSGWRDSRAASGQSAFAIDMTASAAGRRSGLRSAGGGDPAYELRRSFAQATTSPPARGRSAGAPPSRERRSSGAILTTRGHSRGAAPTPAGRSPGATAAGVYVPPSPDSGIAGGGGGM
jgi:hypothetical protein